MGLAQWRLRVSQRLGRWLMARGARVMGFEAYCFGDVHARGVRVAALYGTTVQDSLAFADYVLKLQQKAQQVEAARALIVSPSGEPLSSGRMH